MKPTTGWACWLVLAGACASAQSIRTTDALFATPEAELARELAPDLYHRADDARARAGSASRKDDAAMRDAEDESSLWLAAAVAEAERIQLARRTGELRGEEERWAKQLARDQEASAVVATDISRYRARAVALAEAERVAALSEGGSTSKETLDAVLTRVRLNLALAEALGAPVAEVRQLRARADTMARTRPRSPSPAEKLMLDTEALLGRTRAQWPEPQPGAATELVQTAFVTGFSADRTANGVVVRSERFFRSNGQVSQATVKRFQGLVAAYPHGPVACQIAVPELQDRLWSRRAAQLVDRLRQIDESRRISTRVIETASIGAGTVQCTFASYRQL